MSKENSTPRARAIDILCEWQKSSKSIDQLKDESLSKPFPDPRDNQLTHALIFGVLRNLALLDFIIAKFSKHPLKKMKALTLQALRVGLYQLLYMDRIPPSAAINETVKVIKKRRQPKWLTGFVNGMLRNIDRKKNSLYDENKLPSHAKLNHPQWLIDRWQKRFGAGQTSEICLLNNQPAPLFICVNSNKISQEDLLEKFANKGVIAKAGQLSPDAIQLTCYHGPIADLPGFEDGLFYVQDEIAQLVVHLLNPFPSGAYLDGCAGLGGKTSLIAQKIPEDATLTAVEPQLGRLNLLKENLSRLSLEQVQIFPGDINSFKNIKPQKFSGVLVDVPCSGTGVIRRHPDIRWNRNIDDFNNFQKKQLEILEIAAELTEPGGVLVYATCSMEPEENENVIDMFLEKRADFKIDNAAKCLPKSATKLVDERGFLRTMPGPVSSDGFFAARLQLEK